MRNNVSVSTQQWREAIGDASLVGQALRVALLVGTLLFVINHGPALVSGSMTLNRWVSAGLSYLVPFVVNLHGQIHGRAVSSPRDG